MRTMQQKAGCMCVFFLVSKNFIRIFKENVGEVDDIKFKVIYV